MKSADEIKALSDAELEAYRLELDAQWDVLRAHMRSVVSERNQRAAEARAKKAVADMSPADREALSRALGAQTIQVETLRAVGDPAPLKA